MTAAVDPRFGRCAYFLIVDTESGVVDAVRNSAGESGGGAGIQSAKLIADRGVKAVLTGNCGPNAHRTLTAANIDVIVGVGGTIEEAKAQYIAGTLRAVSGPNVESHAGMRNAPQ